MITQYQGDADAEEDEETGKKPQISNWELQKRLFRLTKPHR